LGKSDFIRVPLPAARIATATINITTTTESKHAFTKIPHCSIQQMQ
jgi:hypothetical protein